MLLLSVESKRFLGPQFFYEATLHEFSVCESFGSAEDGRHPQIFSEVVWGGGEVGANWVIVTQTGGPLVLLKAVSKRPVCLPNVNPIASCTAQQIDEVGGLACEVGAYFKTSFGADKRGGWVKVRARFAVGRSAAGVAWRDFFWSSA